MMMMM